MERLGIPTVTIATTEFLGLSKNTALSQGAADMCFLVVAHPMGMIPLGDIQKKAKDAFPEILKAATEWKPVAKLPPMKPPYPAERFTFKGTVEDLNKFFFEKGWSLGLPIIPPTPERVAKMLKGTSHKPDEVVWIVPPRMGALTVELVAVHAVMAGCKPEYLPVILAAIEAMSEPIYNWRGATTTTGTVGPMLLINGPIVKELGIAYGQGAAAGGYHPNVSIGYTINLIGDIIGGSKSPEVDKSTFGSPADIVAWVFGENEDANPWESYAVEHGFKPTDNVITMKNVYPTIDMPDHSSSTPEAHMTWWKHRVTPLGSPLCLKPGEFFFVLAPEQARMLAKAGWTKDKFRKTLWKEARAPLSTWGTGTEMCGIGPVPKEFSPATPDTLIPITLTPEEIEIVVAGGSGKHSQVFTPGQGMAVSKLVDKWK